MEQFGYILFDNLNTLLNEVSGGLSTAADTMENKLSKADLIHQFIGLLNLLESSGVVNEDVDLKYLKDLVSALHDLYESICALHTSDSGCSLFADLDFGTILSGTPGRPKCNIPKVALEELRGLGFSWSKISLMFKVSRWTIHRRVKEYDLETMQQFSEISDADIDKIIKEYISRHGPTTGEPILSGYFRSKGLVIQRRRIRSSLNRVDPKNTALRWGALVTRRSYYVPWPNSLWHIDGHHSLIRWKLVVHGCIDGKSRKIMFLRCDNNNRAETVLNLFQNAITENHNLWPSRVRVDYGVENVLVCDAIVEKHGEGRGSFIAGSSTRNQRIERLWRDVFRCVLVAFYYSFYALEQCDLLHCDDDVELYALHYVFLQRINFALNEFNDAYNYHRLSTERNWTPNQIWLNGMLDSDNPLNKGQLDDNPDNMDFYGEDLQGPISTEGNNVQVPPISIPFEDFLRNYLKTKIEANAESNEMGIDIYLKTLRLVEEKLHELAE